MKPLCLTLIGVMVLGFSTLAAAQQPGGQMQMPMGGQHGQPGQPPGQPPMMGPGMMGPGMMGMMCPMMGMMQQMMGGMMDPSGMGMMGTMGGKMDPKAMGRMLQMRGEMLKAMGDILLKHGRMMEEGK